jgi:hypothetical protein
MQIPKVPQVLLIEDPIFEPGAHENVKTRFRSQGPHGFGNGDERRDSDASRGQHDIGSPLDQESVAQRTDEIQGLSRFAGGEPPRSFPYDPVKDLEAGGTVLFCEAMHAEGAPEHGVHPVGAADVVKLSGDRAMIILG